MTCRLAAEVISLELDTELPIHLWVVLGIHTLVCGSCRRYRHQLAALDAATAEFLARPEIGTATVLPDETKNHLRAVIAAQLNKNS